jgi:multidrug transporter EmrE-like cation transporter
MLAGDPVSTTPAIAPAPAAGASRRRSVLLVFACTVLGAAAQLLIKIGMSHFTPDPAAIATNLPLVAGYALYGINTLMLVLALKDGELSMLYPIIALTYVWVTLLSYTLLPEKPNVYKNVGIATIVIGVAVLGRGGRKK